MAFDLVELCRQAVVLVEETLRTRRAGSARVAPHIALAAVPTPDLAAGDERHGLGLAAVRTVHDLLGENTPHSVSHTTGVSIVIGVLDGALGIDLERLAPARPRIAQRILTARELQALGSNADWPTILRCFCIKEAAYKILDEVQQEDLRFRGLELVTPSADSTTVERCGEQHVVAVAAAARGYEALVAIATRPDR
jgi:phosphopantetheinyl transferase (holo-ACP synthase)